VRIGSALEFCHTHFVRQKLGSARYFGSAIMQDSPPDSPVSYNESIDILGNDTLNAHGRVSMSGIVRQNQSPARGLALEPAAAAAAVASSVEQNTQNSKTGKLFKRSRKNLFWNERWVHISNRQIHIRNEPNELTPKQVISLEYATLNLLGRKGKKYPFEVVTGLGSRFEFATDSEESRSAWVDFIGKQINPNLESMLAFNRNSNMGQSPTRQNEFPAAEASDAYGEEMEDSFLTETCGGEGLDQSGVLVRQQQQVADEDEFPNVQLHEDDGKDELEVGADMQDIDFNERYQKILELPENMMDDSIRKALKLNRLTKDFVEVATVAARTIVDEYCLPRDMKMIAPLEEDESLAPEQCTYIEPHTGIFFNFFNNIAMDFGPDGALSDLDFEELSEEMLELLEENKLKTATNEIHGYNAILSTSNSLKPPLSCIIDYRGFRIFACAILPVLHKSSSLVYGKQSDGSWVCDSEALSHLKIVGKKLNLLEHKSVDGEFDVPTSSKVEILRGEDGRLYIQKLNHLFPADLIHRIGSSDDEQSEADLVGELFWFTRQFREEFLLKGDCGILSSDVYEPGTESDEMNQAKAATASTLLLDTTIPSLVYELEMLTATPLCGSELCDLLHASGINIRYLGQIFITTKLTFLKQLSAAEMVARSCKKLFQSEVRRAIRKFSQHGSKTDQDHVTTAEEHYDRMETLNAQLIQVAVDFLNRVLGKSKEADLFWKQEILPKVVEKFEGVTAECCSDLRSFVPPMLLFITLQKKLSLKFQSPLAYQEDPFNPSDTPFHTDDILSLEPCVKFATKKNLSAFELPNKADGYIREENWNFAVRALKLKNEIVLGERTGIYRLRKQEHVYIQTLNSLCEGFLHLKNLTQSKEFAKAAINLSSDFNPQICQTYFNLLGVYFLEDDEELALQSFEQATSIVQVLYGPDCKHPFLYSIYDMLACKFFEKKKFDEATIYFREALAVSTSCFGKIHPFTASAYTRLGNCLKIVGELDKALHYFLESLDINEKLYTMKNSLGVAQTCFYLSDLFANMKDHANALRYAERALKIREDITGKDSELTSDSIQQVELLQQNHLN
jgi:tetratricopeptide (TPR) repeat protein